VSGRVPRGVRFLALVSFFNDFASEMVYPLLPALVSRLGGGALALGALDGAAELTSAAAKWVSGGLSDRRGWRKPLILGGYLVAVLVRPLIAFAGAAWQVVGLRVADRVGKGLRTPPRDAFIAELTPNESRGRAYGFHRGADHLGAVLGSVAAWLLISRGMEVPQVISWSVVPGIAAVAILAITLKHERTASEKRPNSGREAVEERTEGGRVFWVPVITLAALTLARMPEALLLLRLQERGVAVATVPLLWGALHVVRSAASYPGGRLTDRFGPRLMVAAGGGLAAAVFGGLAMARSATAGALVFLAFGLVAGLAESAERKLVTELAPRRTGRGFGAYHAVTGLAALPAALAFGWIYQRAGGSVALGVSAAASVAATLAWLSLPRPGSA
jgi:MFS family permease